MPRPAHPIGGYGVITVRNVGPSRYVARTRFRDSDGVTRSIVRHGETEGRAKKALREALAERARHGRIDRETAVRDLAKTWLDDGKPNRTPQTHALYESVTNRHVIPRIGSVRLGEVTPRLCDSVVQGVAENSPSTARTVRTVLSQMFKAAVIRDAIPLNPVRELSSVKTTAKKSPRALTIAETTDMTDRLRSDERAVLLDIPDVVDWMLGTGCRIGEALAVRDDSLDLEADAPSVFIDATVIRLKGQGLRLSPTKTETSRRVLALPPSLIAMVERRRAELRFTAPEGVVFPSPFAPTLRDPSNMAGELRAILNRLGYGWVTSHTFRKTVATRLDDAGWSGRAVADQLGHAQPSMTQNIYLSRKVANPDAARVLDR